MKPKCGQNTFRLWMELIRLRKVVKRKVSNATNFDNLVENFYSEDRDSVVNELAWME